MLITIEVYIYISRYESSRTTAIEVAEYFYFQLSEVKKEARRRVKYERKTVFSFFS